MKTQREIEHGTVTGHAQHVRRRVPVCGPCQAAHDQAVQHSSQRRALFAAGEITVPLSVLGALLLAAPSDIEEQAEAELGSLVVEVAITSASDHDTAAAS